MEGGLHADWWALVLCSLALWSLLGASPVNAGTERRRGGRALLTTQCRQYKPGECALVRQGGDSLASLPFCHIGDGVPVECSFDTKPLEQCPLPKQGMFARMCLLRQCICPSKHRLDLVCKLQAFSALQSQAAPMAQPLVERPL